MEITAYKSIEKISRKGRRSRSLAQPKKLPRSSLLLIHNYSSDSSQKNKRQNRFSIKRISPFFLFGFFLIGLFPYMFITGTGTIHSTSLLLFVFAFLEVNLLVSDFAIWNYFEGKKIFRIWLIEVPLTLLIIHLLI